MRLFLLLTLLLVACAGCGGARDGVDPGKRAIEARGCGGCHEIDGVHDADGRVGPSLDEIAERATIAGVLPNTRRNAVAWILNPQAVSPGTLMPDLGVGAVEARAIVDYLYRNREETR